MVAEELVSCLLERASLQPGQHPWAVFEIVAGGELGNACCYYYYCWLLGEDRSLFHHKLRPTTGPVLNP